MSANRAAKLSLTFVCVILGVFIAFQIKTVNNQKNTELTDSVGLQRANEISAELTQALADKAALQTQLDAAQATIHNYEQTFAQQSDDNAAFIGELDTARMAAGQTELTGRGISVTLKDSANQLQPGVSANVLLIHDEDLLNVINELNDAGAEAISINGQRYTAETAVRCVGAVINVNDVKTAPPFVISAIGDPDVLEAALELPGGVVDSLKPWGISVDITKEQSLTVPKYTGSFVYREAKMVEGDAQ